MTLETLQDTDTSAPATPSATPATADATGSSGDATSNAEIAATAPGQLRVIKRNGTVVPFEASKISVAITKAFLAVEGGTAAASSRIHETVAKLTELVTATFKRRMPSGGTIHKRNPDLGPTETWQAQKALMGDIVIELYEEETPETVANFLNYVRDGDFNSSFVHRSDPGFIIQGDRAEGKSAPCTQGMATTSKPQ